MSSDTPPAPDADPGAHPQVVEVVATSDSSWIVAERQAVVLGHVTSDGGGYTAYDADENLLGRLAAWQDAVDAVAAGRREAGDPLIAPGPAAGNGPTTRHGGR